MKHLKPSLFLRAAGASLGLAAAAAVAQSEALPPSQPGAPTAPSTPLLPEDRVTPQPLPQPTDDIRVSDATQTDGESTQFINKVSMLTDESVRISQIAAQRANNQQVKTLAEQVQQATQALQTELGSLAQTRNILIPTGRAGGAFGGDDDASKWANKDGEDFDEDYVQRVVKLHKDAIEALEDYAEDGSADPELASFAQKHIPVLREQLRQAQALEDQVD